MHYMRQRRTGATTGRTRRTCSTDGCERFVAALGLCERHYRPGHRAKKRREYVALAEERRCVVCDAALDPTMRRGATLCSIVCKNRVQVLRRKYGLALDDYKALIAAQGDSCAICRGPSTSAWGSWHVDHDHATGEVRGLLCSSCNVGLGNFGDDPERLEAAARYLRR